MWANLLPRRVRMVIVPEAVKVRILAPALLFVWLFHPGLLRAPPALSFERILVPIVSLVGETLLLGERSTVLQGLGTAFLLTEVEATSRHGSGLRPGTDILELMVGGF